MIRYIIEKASNGYILHGLTDNFVYVTLEEAFQALLEKFEMPDDKGRYDKVQIIKGFIHDLG